jgi:hypothetical protein
MLCPFPKGLPKHFCTAVNKAKSLGHIVLKSGDDIIIKSGDDGITELARIEGLELSVCT